MCENMIICVKIDFRWIFVSMFENMVICVKILLSLDISVKYAQCVEIWMFLKCVLFPEFLCSVSGEECFLAKQKGDMPPERAYHILVKGDVPTKRVSHILVKENVSCGGTSPFYLICT
jgi:hypothetical protein